MNTFSKIFIKLIKEIVEFIKYINYGIESKKPYSNNDRFNQSTY